MKTLSFQSISLVVGLALGVMVLLSVAAPTTTTAELLVGGWFAGPECNPCIGVNEDGNDCTEGEDEITGDPYGCEDDETLLDICLVGGPVGGANHCQIKDANTPCTQPDGADPICAEVHEGKCEPL